MGYNSVADIIGLSSFVYPWLPPKVMESREIPTKFDLTAVQGHPRSSILVLIESPCTTSYYYSLLCQRQHITDMKSNTIQNIKVKTYTNTQKL